MGRDQDGERTSVNNKMFLRLLIFGALASSFTNGLRYCDDCSKLIECEQAVNQLRLDKSPQMAATLKNAICGFDEDSLPKVCCADFLKKIEGRFQDIHEEQFSNNQDNNEDDIESHPNVSLLPADCGTIEGNRIVGGSAATPFEYPWMALISYRQKNRISFDCGGSVINSNYVLTAAHCIKKNIVGVRVGEYNIKTKMDCYGEGLLRQCFNNVQNIGISNSTVHSGYIRSPVVVNDIALLRLSTPIQFTFSNVSAICLPVFKSLREIDIAGERGTVAGWGFTENRTRSDVLLKVDVPIFSTQSCRGFYERNRRPGSLSPRLKNIFCAGELGHDSCGGDSGGPFMIEGQYNESYRVIQYGVVSFGPIQCGSSSPGVYTDIRQFMKWILDTIAP